MSGSIRVLVSVICQNWSMELCKRRYV